MPLMYISPKQNPWSDILQPSDDALPSCFPGVAFFYEQELLKACALLADAAEAAVGCTPGRLHHI